MWDESSIRPIFTDLLWKPFEGVPGRPELDQFIGLDLLIYDTEDPTMPTLNEITQEATSHVAGQMNNMLFPGNLISLGGTMQIIDMTDRWHWNIYVVKRSMNMTEEQQEIEYLASPTDNYESLIYETHIWRERTGSLEIFHQRDILHGTRLELDPLTQDVINRYHAPIQERRHRITTRERRRWRGNTLGGAD